MTDAAHEKVLIVDFGSQVTQLIARRLRESGVYCEIHPYDKVDAVLDAMAPKAVILSGGPASVHVEGSPSAPPAHLRDGRARAGHLLRRDDPVRPARRRRRGRP
jgi:GMP synthase-like glutamine amidotransferase